MMHICESPSPPKSLQETGVERTLLAGLVLKHLLFLGEFKLADVAERMKLSISLVESLLDEHRREKLVEVKGSTSYTRTSYIFRLTDAGRKKAQEALELCRYVGPAQVSLQEYGERVRKQTVRKISGGEESLTQALSDLVINPGILRRLGPAMISGQAIFIYGPSGNGKTSIAEAIGRALPEEVFIPYAVAVGGQVISVYDPVCHTVLEPREDPKKCDGRWVLVRRPVVTTGGELSLNMLDLRCGPSANYFDGPLQMKANNGVFILDDFGRQQADPVSILNRWLVPLERQVDYMTLPTGSKFVIPFDVLVIFSTDLDPRALLHEAFLRRLRYKIKIERPTEEEYVTIFRKACESKGLSFRWDVCKYLEEHWYGARGIPRNACHPRDLIDLILTHSRYYAKPPDLNLEAMSAACAEYFVQF